ncbi:MAG: nitrous oxide-stimulated promoter family protein [Dehalococcoidia bacterium]|nr:nitrous oxide-stimulated promoter family protein [Dehalococcoidia bacterium]
MPKILERLTEKKARDLKVLKDFVHIFCRQNHRTESGEPFALKDERLRQALGGKELMLCHECSRLLNHGMAKLLLCPYDPKPMCKKCTTHCYAPGYRERIREVMRFSGLYLIKHGRLDLIMHYLF